MPSKYTHKAVQPTKRLVLRLLRIKKTPIHLFAKKVWAGNKIFDMPVNYIKRCAEDGLLVERKLHWYYLTKKGQAMIDNYNEDDLKKTNDGKEE